MDRLKQAMNVFGLLGNPEKLTETAIASLWLVDGQQVLKLYHGATMESEATGVDLLASWPQTAVSILATTQNAVLMEHLKGGSLGDLFRAGQVDQADDTLADLASQAHATALPVTNALPPLDIWFSALFAVQFSPDCAPQLRAAMERAATLAQELLSQSRASWRPLHGDLHHDNVLLGAHGYRCIDAKGVFGAPGYELANAFRNPKGAGEVLRDPEFQRRRIARFAHAMDVPPEEQAGWAAAKCALSIAWRAKGTLSQDPEAALLLLLLDLAVP